jgi:hypothetical protein
MIRVLLSAPLCLHSRLSSRFPCWPEMWIVPRPDWQAVVRTIMTDRYPEER